jgi:Ca-activated chloride channel family protein
MLTVVAVIIALLLVCATLVVYLIADRAAPAAQETPARSNSRQVTLVVAYSPEKGEVFEELVAAFNETKPRLASNKAVVIQPLNLAPDKMVDEAASGAFQALSPDSSIWLGEIDRNWRSEHGADASLVGETVRYMVSPVVIAMWRDAAVNLGYPERDLGWSDILQAAKDNGLRWSHPSTNNASGLLATLAEFYVGAGETRGLTEEMVNDPDTVAYVVELEKTVKHYGEGELAIMERIEQQGRDFLDAFVVQEQLVVRHNLQHGLELVAIYPSEGTLWEDHPLALLETPERTAEERQAFQLFQEYLLSEEVQRLVLGRGYRPADLSISLAGPDSPIDSANGADPARPYTTMQIPSQAVIKVVQDVWLFTKRHANVYLVVDVSGSMAGAKLEDTQQALVAFIDQMSGDWERVGLITFASGVSEQMPLTQLGQGRDALLASIDQLQAGGNTALVDGVELAYTKLSDLADSERINAIVVMTDGRENASRTRASTLAAHIEQSTQSATPILVFCIAYGSDADYQVLERLAVAGGGFAAEGDMETIRTLYETLSTYF